MRQIWGAQEQRLSLLPRTRDLRGKTLVWWPVTVPNFPIVCSVSVQKKEGSFSNVPWLLLDFPACAFPLFFPLGPGNGAACIPVLLAISSEFVLP